jgi:NAD(P)-dependent dehydrogenase (short-subunit alcohol dehydrogenase family)
LIEVKMRSIAITGAASGIGLATAERLRARGDRVIGIDLRDADVTCDLGTAAGRDAAIAEVRGLTGGRLDGIVAAAGVNASSVRPNSQVISVNYFGVVVTLAGLRPCLTASAQPRVVVMGSNSSTCHPNIPDGLVDACLSGDEERARRHSGDYEPAKAYAASKLAIARWCRRQATTDEWAGSGIMLNVVSPGPVDTPLHREREADPQLGAASRALVLPVGRLGQADEIAALTEFLLGPDAGFFCGSFITCDGGLDAQRRSDDSPSTFQPADTSAF